VLCAGRTLAGANRTSIGLSKIHSGFRDPTRARMGVYRIQSGEMRLNKNCWQMECRRRGTWGWPTCPPRRSPWMRYALYFRDCRAKFSLIWTAVMRGVTFAEGNMLQRSETLGSGNTDYRRDHWSRAVRTRISLFRTYIPSCEGKISCQVTQPLPLIS